MNLKARIESYQDDMLRDLNRLLAHDSVAGEPKTGAPCGEAVAQCLEEALTIAGELGLTTRNVEGWVGEASHGQGDDYVAILGHLDIVPVGNDWTANPFGEIRDGRIYGRGTNDDKGPLVAALYALKALREEGAVLTSPVRVIMGTCEETGGPDIETYLKSEPQPKAGFTPDASFPVIYAEKGILRVELRKPLKTSDIEILELTGGSAPNMVPDKATLSYCLDGESTKLALKGLSAHGSTPELGDNAILKLFRSMKQLDRRLAPEMEFLLDAFADVNGEHLGIGLSDEPSGKLTCNLGQLMCDGGQMKLVLDLRIPVTFTDADVISALRLKFAPRGYQLSFGEFTPPLYYPEDLPMIQSLMSVYQEVTGDESARPIAIGGGTYAKSMNNVVAFGPGLPGREEVDHIADEFIRIEDLLTWTHIYAKAILALSNL